MNHSRAMGKTRSVSYGFLLLIGLIWGAHFSFNQIAVSSIPPLSVAAGRALVGAISLTLILRLEASSRPFQSVHGTDRGQWRIWQKMFAIAFFEATLPFFLLAWGQQHINSSSQAAILMGMTPLLTTILAALLIPTTTLSTWNFASIVLGFVGVVILVGSVNILAAIGNVAGNLAILIAALSFSFALVLIKKLASPSPIRAARDLFLCASVQLLPIALVHDRVWSLYPSQNSLLSVLFLGAVCGGVAYVLYFTLIGWNSPTFASFSNYLIPLFGTLLSSIFLHEAITIPKLLALLLIVAATAMNGLTSGDRSLNVPYSRR